MKKIIILLPFTLTGLIVHVLYLSSFSNPVVVEFIYSRGIYPIISNFSVLTAYLPFSAAEVFFYAFCAFIIFYFSRAVYAFLRPYRKKPPSISGEQSWQPQPPPLEESPGEFLPLVFSANEPLLLGADAVITPAYAKQNHILFKNRLRSFGQALLPRLKMFLFRITVLAVIASTMYATFILTWSFNYARAPLADSLGLDASPASVDELFGVCQRLALQANELRSQANEDENGVFRMNKTKQQINIQVKNIFRENAPPFMARGGETNVKGVTTNNLFSRLNLLGMYFPFTYEPNINMQMPDLYYASSALHEYAHFKGFAREDEANFIAYLVSKNSNDTDFSYSSTMLAFVHSFNELNAADGSLGGEIYALLSDGVKRDFDNENTYWEPFKETREAVETMNNNYLQSNNQQDGIRSYGRMVDLLIALDRENSLLAGENQ